MQCTSRSSTWAPSATPLASLLKRKRKQERGRAAVGGQGLLNRKRAGAAGQGVAVDQHPARAAGRRGLEEEPVERRVRGQAEEEPRRAPRRPREIEGCDRLDRVIDAVPVGDARARGVRKPEAAEVGGLGRPRPGAAARRCPAAGERRSRSPRRGRPAGASRSGSSPRARRRRPTWRRSSRTS